MKKYLRPIVFTLACLSFTSLLAQMEVTDASTPPFTPENLISNVFLGDGVSILDISYEGDPRAVGFFKDGAGAIGIERGILLTTGRAASESCFGGPYGADCFGSTFSSNDMASNVNDPDLNAIANAVTEDVAKFTITFQPFADTLRFRYVFASEEYPDFTCSQYNDVFGFFISGPGINGTFQNNGENIALIPGTDLPVAINNVNSGEVGSDGQLANCTPPAGSLDFSQFYVNNDGFDIQPVYNGYTTVLTAEAVVIPCETYTIKLTIADAFDNLYDSGVFLEAKSFGTGTIEVEAATVSLDGAIAEGCSNGSFTFSLPLEAEQDVFLDYNIIGDAINGTDYEFIPDNLFIPMGESSLTIPIIPFFDGIDEGLESIGIDIQRDICNRDTFWMFIRDNEIVPPTLGPNLSICAGDSVALDGTLPMPLPPPVTFTNTIDYFVDDTEPVYSPIEVAGIQPVTLGPGVIQSVCINIEHMFADDLDIFLISPGGQFIELSTDHGQDCDDYPNTCFTPLATTLFTDVVPLGYDCAGGESTNFTGDFVIDGTWEDLWDGDYPTNGTWQLLVIDDSDGFEGDILDWSITFEPIYKLSYSWQPVEGLSCANCPDPFASPSETTTYVLTASDTYGCEVYDTITIEVLEDLAAPVVNCISVTDNSIEFAWEEVFGATEYLVSINGGIFGPPNNGALGHLVDGLGFSEEVTIEVVGVGPCDGETGSTSCITPSCAAPTLTIENINDITCFGETNGLISALATGGAGDYDYSIDGTNTGPNSVFTSLSGGEYEIGVIDSWGCLNSILVTINEPDSLFAVEEILNEVSCFGAGDGSATVEIFGGTPPYVVNWSNGQMQDTATNFLPGSHFVFVTDANNCTDNFNFFITQPTDIIVTPSVTPVDCSGGTNGSIFLQIEGGTAPYFIQWDANANFSTSSTVNNLPIGSYTVAVTDAAGCIQLTEVVINAPSNITTDVTNTAVSCFGANDGTASVSVSGGTGQFIYDWSNGDSDPDVFNLNAGTYYVTVTDPAGCTTLDSAVVESPPVLEISLTGIDALCFGDASGSIQSLVVGGTPPYSYQWDNGTTTPDLQNILAGNYCLEITDANNCILTECTEIFEQTSLILTAVTNNAACNSTEGFIELSVEGGATPYQFIWSDGQTTQNATDLAPGIYEVTVSDANDCTATLTETINENEAISIEFSIEDVSCFGESTGGISVIPSGGSGDYTFSWSGPNGFSASTATIQNAGAGNYELDIEDSDGCSFNSTLTINEPAEPLDAFFTTSNVSCPGDQDGMISIDAFGGTPPYTYQLNGLGFTGNPNFLALPVDIYEVAVLDTNGCGTLIPDVPIDEPAPFTVELGEDRIVAYGDSAYIGAVLNNVPDSLWSNYTYEWSSTNPNMEPLHPDWRVTIFEAFSSTTATLTVTSPTGCVEEDLINIFITTDREITVPTGFTPDNQGAVENNALHVHGKSEMVAQIRSFQVFDRWGELLFEANNFMINDLSIGWDGTFKGEDMPAGVYAWYLEVDFVDGISNNYKGHTTLIR
ncbi:MAG: choice-of-anchor L domain-containing protein [Bacteroidota bacterium]